MGQTLAVAGAGLGAAGSIMAGREQARAAGFERDQLNRRRTETEIAAAQAEAARRQDLTSSLQTIQAISAGRNVASASPSMRAIIARTTADAEGDMMTERFNFTSQAEGLRLASQEAGRRRRAAMLSGFLGAAQAGVQGAADVYRIRSNPGG